MPPLSPFIVSGRVTSGAGNTVGNAFLQFVTGSGTGRAFSNVEGDYVIDLANVGYADGETVTWVVVSPSNDELGSGSFVVSGGSESLDVQLSFRDTDGFVHPPSSRHVQIASVGGKLVNPENPLFVANTSVPSVDDGSVTMTYDGSGNMTQLQKTINGVTYTRNFTYDGSDNLTNVSAWTTS